MLTTQSHAPLTLNANLSHTTVLLSFSHYRSRLCLDFMLTRMWYSATARHFSVGLCLRSVYYFFWRRVVFILNSALPSRLDTFPPPPFQLSIYSPHSIQGPASSYYYADCSWSVKAGFVCSSRCSWWRFIEETDWNEYAKTDVLSSSSFALWTEQCLAVTCLCWYIHDAGKKVCIYSYETIVLSQTFFYLIALFNTGLGSLTSKEGHSAVNQKSFSVDNVRAVLKSDGEVDLLST